MYNRGDDIDRALRGVIDEAVAKKVRLVEIIPGKGSGQLKKRVLRFLEQKDVKALYDRVEKDSHNFGRIFVHFRPK
jgi:dsDNA-specific endonuclease/ATPase MutS2